MASEYYLSFSNDLMHTALGEQWDRSKVKYIKRVKRDNGKYRYFYTQSELDAFYKGISDAGNKIAKTVSKVGNDIQKVTSDAVKTMQKVANWGLTKMLGLNFMKKEVRVPVKRYAEPIGPNKQFKDQRTVTTSDGRTFNVQGRSNIPKGPSSTLEMLRNKANQKGPSSTLEMLRNKANQKGPSSTLEMLRNKANQKGPSSTLEMLRNKANQKGPSSTLEMLRNKANQKEPSRPSRHSKTTKERLKKINLGYDTRHTKQLSDRDDKMLSSRLRMNTGIYDEDVGLFKSKEKPKITDDYVKQVIAEVNPWRLTDEEEEMRAEKNRYVTDYGHYNCPRTSMAVAMRLKGYECQASVIDRGLTNSEIRKMVNDQFTNVKEYNIREDQYEMGNGKEVKQEVDNIAKNLKPGSYGICSVSLDVGNHERGFRHAYNWYINDDGKMIMIDGQTNKIHSDYFCERSFSKAASYRDNNFFNDGKEIEAPEYMNVEDFIIYDLTDSEVKPTNYHNNVGNDVYNQTATYNKSHKDQILADYYFGQYQTSRQIPHTERRYAEEYLGHEPTPEYERVSYEKPEDRQELKNISDRRASNSEYISREERDGYYIYKYRDKNTGEIIEKKIKKNA